MTAFAASVISADIGFNVNFSFAVDGAEFGGIFYRADTIPAATWVQFCNGTLNSTIKSPVPAGITHITAGTTSGGSTIVMFSLIGPPVFVATIYTDDMVTREILRRFGAQITAAASSLEEQSE